MQGSLYLTSTHQHITDQASLHGSLRASGMEPRAYPGACTVNPDWSWWCLLERRKYNPARVQLNFERPECLHVHQGTAGTNSIGKLVASQNYHATYPCYPWLPPKM